MGYKHQAKKSLGQNFLTDLNTVGKILRAFDPQPGQNILEIGPGHGALTVRLTEHDTRVTAVELDTQIAEDLRKRGLPGLQVMTGDVLECDITAVAGTTEDGRLRVIGNIPYYITSPILFHLIGHRRAIADAMIMMQLEVAQRLVAPSGGKDYGILSVATQTYAIPRLLFKVPPTCFTPRPGVTSAVVHLTFRDLPGIAGLESIHSKILRTVFNQRRKMLRNAIDQIFQNSQQRNHAFQTAQIDDTRRAETLTPEDFIRLARACQSVLGRGTPDSAA